MADGEGLQSSERAPLGAFYDALPQRDPSLAASWHTAEFRRRLRAWCGSVVGPLTGMEQHKLRGWATVWRVTSAEGVFFAKQNCAGQQMEIEVMGTLARLVPEHVVPVTAARDGFLLTPDQGPVFHETAGDDLVNWERLARDAARLQRAAVEHHGALVAAGMTELRPEQVTDYVAARVEQYAALPVGDVSRLDPELATRLRAHLPVVRRWADEVAALGLPVTLNHNDLHENNVFDVGGRLRFFDFGDALLTEPLGVLLIPLNILSGRLEAGPDDSRLWRVADAALEVWGDLVPTTQLRAALPAALQLGRLGRVESWVRCLPALTDEELPEHGQNAVAWLGTLLEQPPVGSLDPPQQ